MAGHSQFKNIMYRKGAQDAKRARMFAKITREIIVSARMGADPSSNPRLRAAMAAARGANMPKDNVDRAIKKALGGEDTANYEEVRYEGYGPGGTALIVESLTDNRNRTASEVRSAFTKCGGNMGETGSVAFMFDRVGVIRLSKAVGSYDDVFEKAVDAGADNLEEDGDFYEVLTGLDNFAMVRDALSLSYEDISESKLMWRPQNTISVDEEAAQKIIKLIDTLEDSDDVQNVYCNFDVSDDILAKLA
ncbi:YebC/PmpR family DNA-binding transcriptional regulator [Candidatus Odyssella acanthamoebae]|uniref:Probable transcriptional regulatory protein ID47_09270 n=1 Tax=Candidatus Odyssella acanthamoebae TaxID=91604 RepID=A0A077AZ19_9PROT|nr:YebC/PmpR family DNA-binding transcriptional regulator [Candidatus Paracaedibacter acanthamoebae]AIK96883.1 transcriptional regulator [Candidatus Paracaedibacter acanthamoebae]